MTLMRTLGTQVALSPGVCSMKGLPPPPGWDASPLQGYNGLALVCRYPVIHLGGDRQYESKVSCTRKQHNVPDNTRSRVQHAYYQATAPVHDNTLRCHKFQGFGKFTSCTHEANICKTFEFRLYKQELTLYLAYEIILIKIPHKCVTHISRILYPEIVPKLKDLWSNGYKVIFCNFSGCQI